MSLKQKTVTGILWSAIDNFITYGITVVVGIILARLLTPAEFGLIGMTSIFIAVSESIIRSGFSDALIRKNHCTQDDYSTVFAYNLFVGLFFVALLYFTAPAISNFFSEPKLKTIIRVLSIVLIIESITIIQRTILTLRVDFKLQARISIIASSGSGILAIILAYRGFGVWSLVALTLTKEVLNSLFLWLWNNWRPALIFNKSSFMELFGFGSKLLVSGLLDTIYYNIYNLAIGKYYSASDLGYYTRANNFSSLPSRNINMVLNRVTYPVLAEIQDDPATMKDVYRRIIRSVMLVTFVLMFGLAAVAEPMVISFIGEKWRPSIIYLQMLCFGNMLYPLQALNLNMLKISGRSDLFLKLEVIKKSLAIPVIILGVLFGIKLMIVGMIMNSYISYYINSYWSGKFINYGIKEQLKDILPSFLLAIVMAAIIFVLGYFLKTSFFIILIVQVISGALIVISICEAIKMPDYIYLKQIVVRKVISRRK
jgi:teichuronic acid exporter